MQAFQLIILSLGGLAIGIVSIIFKKLAHLKFHPTTFVLAQHILLTLFAAPLLFYQLKLATSATIWIIAIISISSFAIGFTLNFKALKLIDASAVALIRRLSIPIAAILGLIILSQTLTFKSIIGLILITFGAIIILYQKQHFTLSRGYVFALLMAFGTALALILDKIVLNEFSPITYAFINPLVTTTIFSLIPTARKELPQILKKHLVPLIATSSLGLAAWLSMMFILQSGTASIVYAVYSSMGLVSTVGLSIIVLKETQRLPQKLIGTLIILLGIFLTS